MNGSMIREKVAHEQRPKKGQDYLVYVPFKRDTDSLPVVKK